jgi:hypothetical protein
LERERRWLQLTRAYKEVLLTPTKEFVLARKKKKRQKMTSRGQERLGDERNRQEDRTSLVFSTYGSKYLIGTHKSIILITLI